MRNHQIAPRPENEFFAFFGLRLGRERKWAESFCSLPSRVATRDGAQVGLHRSLILRTGLYTIARLTHHFLSGLSKTNVKESRWTFSPRKSGHFKPRFCGHLFPRLTPGQAGFASWWSAVRVGRFVGRCERRAPRPAQSAGQLPAGALGVMWKVSA
jgi:hypothetical protein